MLTWTSFCHIDLKFFPLDFKIHITKNYKPRKRRKPKKKKKKKEGNLEERKKERIRRSTTKKKTHGTHKPSLHQAHLDRRSMIQFTISITEQTISIVAISSFNKLTINQ